MPSFFSQMNPKLSPAAADGNIEPEVFLLACKQMLPIIDGFGPAFWPVKRDIDGNITRVLKCHASDPTKFHSFRELLHHEKISDASRDWEYATLSLLWLKRTLEFLVVLLSELVAEHRCGNQSNSLYPASLKAYNQALRPYHGWLVQRIFPILARCIPWKRDFLKTLGGGVTNSVDEVIEDMDAFVTILEGNTRALDVLFKELELDFPDKA